MKKPIVRLNLKDELPEVTITLAPYQHATLDLALRFLINVIESREFDVLENASVEAFAQMRTTIFGIMALLRTETADDELKNDHGGSTDPATFTT